MLQKIIILQVSYSSFCVPQPPSRTLINKHKKGVEIVSALSKLTGFSHRPTTIDKATAPHRYLHIAMPFGKHIGNRCRCYCQSSSCSSNFARICQLKIISITPFKNMLLQLCALRSTVTRCKISEKIYLWGCVCRIKSGNVLYNIYLCVLLPVQFPMSYSSFLQGTRWEKWTPRKRDAHLQTDNHSCLIIYQLKV